MLEYHNDVPAWELLIDSLPSPYNLGYQAIALEGITSSNNNLIYQKALEDIQSTRDLLLEDFPDKQNLINQLFPSTPPKLQRLDKKTPILRHMGSEHTAIVFTCTQWLREAIDQLPSAPDDQKINEAIKRLETIVTRSFSKHNYICLADALNQYCLEILPLDPDHFIELPCNGRYFNEKK